MQETPKKPENRLAGFNCPVCSFFIEVSIKGLLYDTNHRCPRCSTDFKMDRNESSEALELIQKVHTAMENLDSVKEFKL
jgi:transcription elongation factor Elf1